MSKLAWGLIGGGEDSQIGSAHRIAAGLDGAFAFAAGALDIDPARGRAFALRLGAERDRAYGDWREMLESESRRPDRVDLVTVATPNQTHFEITKAFLEAGFDVLCEKPMTTTVAEAAEVAALARDKGRLCAVNYGYSGYPLVRQMRAMVAAGELGRVRLVVAEFAHGFHADAADAGNPRVRWRYDPAQAGVSSVLADAGSHALHMACFVTGQQVSRLSADFASCIEGRALEDDAQVAFRMTGGAVGRLWTSAVAVGRMHGLTLQVFGERGGLSWAQEQPNQLSWTPLNEATRILERGGPNLSASAQRSSRLVVGHAEGLFGAFGNVYADLAEVILARKDGRSPSAEALHYPSAAEGLHSIAAIHAAAASAKSGGAWTDVTA